MPKTARLQVAVESRADAVTPNVLCFFRLELLGPSATIGVRCQFGEPVKKSTALYKTGQG